MRVSIRNRFVYVHIFKREDVCVFVIYDYYIDKGVRKRRKRLDFLFKN